MLTAFLYFFLLADKPEMDLSPARIKAASNIGSTGRLICRTSSVPKPTFNWFRNGVVISPNVSNKYFSEFHEVSETFFCHVCLKLELVRIDITNFFADQFHHLRIDSCDQRRRGDRLRKIRMRSEERRRFFEIDDRVGRDVSTRRSALYYGAERDARFGDDFLGPRIRRRTENVLQNQIQARKHE